MSGGYRGIVIATFAGLTSIALGLGYYLGALNYPHEKRYPPYQRGNGEPPQIAWTAPFSERTKYSEPCKQPQGRDESDLCAQWKAARAAVAGALWAKWSFFLGIAGTFGLFWTLFYTRQAVRVAQDATKDADTALAIARKNADAAAEHVAISQDSAQRQLRAYLSISVLGGPGRGNLTNSAVSFGCCNYGQTPASNMTIHTAKFSGPKKLPSDHEIDNWQDTGAGGNMPAREAVTQDFGINVQLTPAVARYFAEISNPEVFYVAARIGYDDVFGNRHLEQICGYLHWERAWDDEHPPRIVTASRHNIST